MQSRNSRLSLSVGSLEPSMGRVLRCMVVAALLSGATMASATVAPADAEDVTVKGEVIDLACYLYHGQRGPEHKACAVLCARKGVPMGVLTESGDVYLLVDDHQNSDPYDATKKLSGGNAEIKGKKVSKGGMTAIVVEEVKGL